MVVDRPVDTRVRVGSIELPHAVMTAAGTSGHGAELGRYCDLSTLGAVVVKSLSVMPWPGNPAPRLHPLPEGMINSVGLQGPGVAGWFDEFFPELVRSGGRVVVSLWGRSVDEYRQAALATADGIRRTGRAGDCVIAVEVNLSCPNLEGRRGIFAHDAELSAAVVAESVAALAGAPRPVWAKLSPNTDRLVEIAGAVRAAGAEAVTLVNTVLGLVIDPDTGRPVLGNGGGGVSGRIIHPVAQRAIFDVAAAHPDLPIVGVGGVSSATEAVALLQAGASAVQVGTATFADPRAPEIVARDLVTWAADRGIGRLADLTGVAHRGGIHPLPPAQG
ncbi:MAG: dihydroorotate dehydrogenase B catalytic subunit [Acidimicrobiales bacterium mtb01]|nr:dihydroorotate dehydrogenase [Actinomycetota bacterium]TEX45018.1 MAG: dihydroorotate dehydrogenase B catalytic subunit [Acidimicrobiales bacterium mtb01]